VIVAVRNSSSRYACAITSALVVEAVADWAIAKAAASVACCRLVCFVAMRAKSMATPAPARSGRMATSKVIAVLSPRFSGNRQTLAFRRFLEIRQNMRRSKPIQAGAAGRFS
jgi:hypothetical protein